jgi:hypothetical protein
MPQADIAQQLPGVSNGGPYAMQMTCTEDRRQAAMSNSATN